jgi:peptide deformylase
MFLMKDIVREGHPSLRIKAEDVNLPLNEVDAKLAQDLLDYVINSQNEDMIDKYDLRPGIGIAATQVNVAKRMFALNIESEEGNVTFVAINPKIVSHSVEKTYLSAGEGCLSVDRVIEGYVPRYSRITVKGFHPDGSEFKMRLNGLPSIAFQHELDHLNGIMFFDRINESDPFANIPNSVPFDREKTIK